MNNFSFNRFSRTLRWVVGVNFRSLMIWTLGYMVGVFLGEQLFFGMSFGNDVASILSNISQFFTIFILIALGVGLSTVFYDLNKKTRREAFLMLPASNLEKFLSAVVYVTFVWTFFVALSFVAGDTLRMVYRALVNGDEWISTVPMVMNTMEPGFVEVFKHESTLEYMVMYTFVICAFIVWMHSLYLLGGTLFRKYSFVVSSLVLIMSVSFLAWLTGHCHIQMFSSSWEGDHYVRQEVGPLGYVLAVVLPLLSVFNYWASYRIFKGMQLITNKWTNYDFHK
ncbi:MAG: hypothetical protein II404_09290 [Prevotella sp.]|nr:hypothetical protein [Prevotella sp.]